MCRLSKALYDLKQTRHVWYARINGHFKQQGFQKSESEATLYVKESGKNEVLYVNDLICISNV